MLSKNTVGTARIKNNPPSSPTGTLKQSQYRNFSAKQTPPDTRLSSIDEMKVKRNDVVLIISAETPDPKPLPYAKRCAKTHVIARYESGPLQAEPD